MFSSFLSPQDPDAPLVTAARGGDIHAFDVIVRRYQARMLLFVRARLDRAIDAEDVTQDVFVAAWCHLPRFAGRSRFRTWLFGIALNHCAEAARRHRVVKLMMVGPDGVDGVDGLEGADGRLEAADPDSGRDWPSMYAEREEVRMRLAELPELERQVLELYYFAELNLPEISRLLNVNLSTLKYRFYQGHRRLRRSLEPDEVRGGPEKSSRGNPGSLHVAVERRRL